MAWAVLLARPFGLKSHCLSMEDSPRAIAVGVGAHAGGDDGATHHGSSKAPVRPKLDPFLGIIDRILAEDKSRWTPPAQELRRRSQASLHGEEIKGL